MTENEIINSLEDLHSQIKDDDIQICYTSDEVEAVKKAIDLIKELQQYKAIVTVEEIKQAMNKQIAKNPVNIQDEVFGDMHTVCPSCKSSALVNPYRAGREGYPYCPWCGQKLDWSEPYKRLECE